MASTPPTRVKFSLWRHLAILLIVLSAIALGTLTYLLEDVPSPTKLTNGDFPVSTQIFDRNGELLYDIYTDQNRTPIKLSDLPPHVKQATISIEDKNFYRHPGIDLSGVTRAAIKTLSGQRLEGGSTITQQLVKITLLNSNRTLTRKVREAALALATEVIYSKDEILEMYLNHAPYGGTAYGIEQAARHYFDKPAKDLTVAEAALLAGLPQAPSRFSPFGSHPEIAADRQRDVLRRMREDGYITSEQEQEALSQPLAYSTDKIPIRAPHFVFWVKDLLVEAFGEKTVQRGGLRVTTTLDLATQDQAQEIVSEEIEKLKGLRVGNGAALITNPATGEILAMIGSQDYFDNENDGNVNVTIRPRQPGSSIKPIMYASGLSSGKFTPSTMWLDIPTCFNVPGQPKYCPRNYDGTFHGPVQVRFALGNSYNVPAVKSLAYIGLEDMIATATAMGISSFTDPSRYGLSLTLGGGEVSMADMATAFGTLANNGVKVPLNPFLKIEDYRGNVLFEDQAEARQEKLVAIQQDDAENGEVALAAADPTPAPTLPASAAEGQSGFRATPPVRAIPAPAAYLISHILLDNVARTAAFGPSSKLVIPNQVVSVKTGTTNDLKDNWTIGYTPERLVAVWVGNNNGKPMNQALVSGITGAAPIWNQLMSAVLKDRKPIWPEKPRAVVGRDVCNLTGKLPTPEFPCDTRHEFFWEKYLPENNYLIQKEILVRKDTGIPPDPTGQPGDQPVEYEMRTQTILSDPLVPSYCANCNYPVEQDVNPDGSIKATRVLYQGFDVSVTTLPKNPFERKKPEKQKQNN